MVVLNASERMEFGYIEGLGYRHDQLPVKTLSTKSLTHSLAANMSPMAQFMLEELSAFPVTPLRSLLEALAWFPLDFAPCGFPFC